MSKLAGDFALIMLITTKLSIKGLKEELSQLNNLNIFIRDATAYTSKFKGQTRQLILNGADNEGIVYNVTDHLRKNNINILTMDTDTVQAPISGTNLFIMKAIIEIPDTLTMSDLENDLIELGNELDIDLELKLVI